MKTAFTTLVLITGLFLAGQAMAMDLSQARVQGLVGEKTDGYVAAVTPSAEANAIVSDVNARRLVEYKKISAQNGQAVSVVGTVAAERIIAGLPSGSYYMSSDGSWKKK